MQGSDLPLQFGLEAVQGVGPLIIIKSLDIVTRLFAQASERRMGSPIAEVSGQCCVKCLFCRARIAVFLIQPG